MARHSAVTRLKRAERDLANAELNLARATYWADLAHSRGNLLHEHERAAWHRAHERVLVLRARVEIRRAAVERATHRTEGPCTS